jgi:hypothetical protein
MDSVGGRKKCVARLYRNPIDQLFDLARERRIAQALASDRLAEPERDGGPWVCRENVPHLGLAARAILAIVGMYLHGEPLGSEDQLH